MVRVEKVAATARIFASPTPVPISFKRSIGQQPLPIFAFSLQAVSPIRSVLGTVNCLPRTQPQLFYAILPINFARPTPST